MTLDSKTIELVEKARLGCRESHASLYSNFRLLVYTTAYKILKHHDDSEDAVQLTFIRVFKKLPTLRDPQAFIGWMRQITRNQSFLVLERRLRETCMSQINEEYESFVLDLHHDGFQEAERRDDLRVFRLCRRKLPKGNREVIKRVCMGHPIKKISKDLNLPLGSVKRRCFDARTHLYNTALEKGFVGEPGDSYLCSRCGKPRESKEILECEKCGKERSQGWGRFKKRRKLVKVR